MTGTEPRTEWIDERALLIHDFLSPERCRALIASTEAAGYDEATINDAVEARRVTSVRNNDRVIHDDPSLADELFCLAQPSLPKALKRPPLRLNERFRFYRYTPGQFFRWHLDGAYVKSPSERSFYTFMIYLNDDFTGGATEFESQRVEPATGMALVFWHLLRHQGAPVVEGVKYAMRTDVMYRL